MYPNLIIKRIKNLLKRVRYWAQTKLRGWSDGDLMSLDHHISKLILPRLKRFKAVTIGHPSGLTENEWNEILDKMIASFEFHASDKRFLVANSEWESHEEGLQLFAKYYTALWF